MAFDPNRVYPIRYLVEKWGKPAPPPGRIVEVGHSEMQLSRDDHGYSDEVFLASIIGGDDVLLLDSVGGPTPSKRVLRLVRDAIDHHLKHHPTETVE